MYKAEFTPFEAEGELIAEAVASLLVGLLRAWLETGMALPPERLVALTKGLVSSAKA